MRVFVLVLVCALAGENLIAQPAQKNYKDRGEYDLYSETAQDFAANNFAKALIDLDRWKEKYAESEFKADRQIFYVQAYAGANQPAKALEAAEPVLADQTQTPDKSGNLLRVLYTVVSSIERIPDPTPQQLALAVKAARRLLAYDTAPDGVNAAAWETTRAQLHSAAKATLLMVAIAPAARATKAVSKSKEDCATAETASLAALKEFPDSAQAAWYLATAEVCLSKADPSKASFALYEFARAAALDPTIAMVDKKWQQTNVVPYLEKAYAQFHGEDPQGLADLKQLALQSPLPPAGFAIKSVTEIKAEQDADYEAKHPELVLWMKLRTALASPDGEHYFEAELKGSAVPPLQGMLIAAKPDCRPTELRVALASVSGPPEVLLKLEKPLAGKPEPGQFRWTGIPTAFSPDPFLLTMEVDPANLENLTVAPCPPAPKPKR